MERDAQFINPNEELLEKLRVNKESAFKHRRRRHFDWTDNYTLYRDKVMLNRLTQRQSVNVPLIKSTIKTLLKDVDDPPVLYFSNILSIYLSYRAVLSSHVLWLQSDEYVHA